MSATASRNETRSGADVVGLDFPCMDCLIHLPRLPAPNESMRVLETSWQSGGKVATAMAALGRLGAKGAIVGGVTDDLWGRFCKEDLAYHGVDTSRLRELPGRMGLNFVLSDDVSKGRNILYSGSKRAPYALEEADLALIRGAKILHICYWGELQLQAAKAAREAGVLVSYDGDGYGEGALELLPYVDVFIGSEFFYKDCFGEGGRDPAEIEANCRSFRERGPSVVGFTFGGDSSAALDDTGFYTAAPPAVKVVDTVGAGDTYHGAFVYGMLQEWPLPQVLAFANAVASMKCRYIGGRAGLPTLEMVERFLATGDSGEGDIPQRLERYRSGII